MNMPGFAAEAALHQTGRFYRHVGRPTPGVASYVVTARFPESYCQRQCDARFALAKECCDPSLPWYLGANYYCLTTYGVPDVSCNDANGNFDDGSYAYTECSNKCAVSASGPTGGHSPIRGGSLQ